MMGGKLVSKFLYFMYLLLVFIYLLSCLKMEGYHLLAVITIDLIYTRSYFERVPSSCLFPTNANKLFLLMKKIISQSQLV